MNVFPNCPFRKLSTCAIGFPVLNSSNKIYFLHDILYSKVFKPNLTNVDERDFLFSSFKKVIKVTTLWLACLAQKFKLSSSFERSWLWSDSDIQLIKTWTQDAMNLIWFQVHYTFTHGMLYEISAERWGICLGNYYCRTMSGILGKWRTIIASVN